jgi:hypothetical protein
MTYHDEGEMALTGAATPADQQNDLTPAHAAGNGQPPVALLNKADLLKARPMPTRKVLIPALGGEVLCRAVRSIERDRYEKSLQKQRGSKSESNLENFRAKLVVLGTLNPDGTQMFHSGEEKVVGELGADITSPLFDTIAELSGMTKQDIEELEEQLKNDRRGSE